MTHREFLPAGHETHSSVAGSETFSRFFRPIDRVRQPAAKLNPSVNSLFITGVNVGSQYNVQIRAVNCAGVPSPWVQAGPETISAVVSPFTYNGVPVAPTGTLTAQSTASGTQISAGEPGQLNSTCNHRPRRPNIRADGRPRAVGH